MRDPKKRAGSKHVKQQQQHATTPRISGWTSNLPPLPQGLCESPEGSVPWWTGDANLIIYWLWLVWLLWVVVVVVVVGCGCCGLWVVVVVVVVGCRLWVVGCWLLVVVGCCCWLLLLLLLLLWWWWWWWWRRRHGLRRRMRARTIRNSRYKRWCLIFGLLHRQLLRTVGVCSLIISMHLLTSLVPLMVVKIFQQDSACR